MAKYQQMSSHKGQFGEGVCDKIVYSHKGYYCQSWDL